MADSVNFKERLLVELTKHVGRSRSIGMGELYERVYCRSYKSRINGTRQLRLLVTELRRDGVAVCSTADSEGGGYWLASSGSELDDCCKAMRRRALGILAMEAKLRKNTLPQLLDQIQLNLRLSEGA